MRHAVSLVYRNIEREDRMGMTDSATVCHTKLLGAQIISLHGEKLLYMVRILGLHEQKAHSWLFLHYLIESLNTLVVYLIGDSL